MNIADDILRYNLRNVYFLTGTACGGKTTMAGAIAQKYGYIHFNDNYHEDNFAAWERLCAERQKDAPPSGEYDWEHHFNRPPEEYNASLDKSYLEYIEYAVIEIIKISQNQIVIADMSLPCGLVSQWAPRHRIACLLASPERVVADYYDRDDHRDIYEAIMRLKEPQKALENMKNVMMQGAQRTIDDARASGLFCLMRDEHSTVDGTLGILERHFRLPGEWV